MQTMNDQEKFSMPTACRRHVYVNYVEFSFVLKKIWLGKFLLDKQGSNRGSYFGHSVAYLNMD
jgi:hypothetical protein